MMNRTTTTTEFRVAFPYYGNSHATQASNFRAGIRSNVHQSYNSNATPVDNVRMPEMNVRNAHFNPNDAQQLQYRGLKQDLENKLKSLKASEKKQINEIKKILAEPITEILSTIATCSLDGSHKLFDKLEQSMDTFNEYMAKQKIYSEAQADYIYQSARILYESHVEKYKDERLAIVMKADLGTEAGLKSIETAICQLKDLDRKAHLDSFDPAGMMYCDGEQWERYKDCSTVYTFALSTQKLRIKEDSKQFIETAGKGLRRGPVLKALQGSMCIDRMHPTLQTTLAAYKSNPYFERHLKYLEKTNKDLHEQVQKTHSPLERKELYAQITERNFFLTKLGFPEKCIALPQEAHATPSPHTQSAAQPEVAANVQTPIIESLLAEYDGTNNPAEQKALFDQIIEINAYQESLKDQIRDIDGHLKVHDIRDATEGMRVEMNRDQLENMKHAALERLEKTTHPLELEAITDQLYVIDECLQKVTKVTKPELACKRETGLFGCQEAFVPIDVSQQFIHAFRVNENTYALADSMSTIAHDVFSVARECRYNVPAEVEAHTYYLIDSIRTSDNPAKIIFNGAMADQVLTDVHQQTAAHVGTPQSLLDRAPGLVARAATKFVYGLNPIKQVGDAVELGVDIGRFVGNTTYRVGAGAVDIAANFGSDGQITAVHNFTEGAVEFLTSTARFTSTVTVGHLYLSPEEYQQRIDDYWQTATTACESHVATCRELGEMAAAAASELTAEQVVDLGAQLAADMVFAKGITRAVQYAKEVQLMAQANKKGSEIAGRLKNAIDVVMAESPVAVTAEGMIFRMADEAGEMGGAAREVRAYAEVLTSANDLLKSAHSGMIAQLHTELEGVRKVFDMTRQGFGEFASKWIKVRYEHILGFDLKFSSRGVAGIGGFHHDMKNVIENSGVLQFMDKVMHKSGFYKANVHHNGTYIKRITFFPSNWSRQEVVGSIMEAYDNFKASGVVTQIGRDGKYLIEGLTKEGVTIEMYITPKGVITSAYPVLK
ncbi:MAG: EndoU domain-containing protein [Candidatus Dependentiae bacterium]|nr:EndoU domain-containing protein [Candidatus Dependentiae bacterium]